MRIVPCSEYRAYSGAVWANIRAPLEQYMRGRTWTRNNINLYWGRRKIALNRWLEYRQENIAKFQILPECADVLFHPIFTEVIEAPPATQVTEASFNDALSRVPEIVAEWQANCENALIALLPTGNSSAGSDHSTQLTLAATVWNCSNCNHNIWYPDVLTHRCLTWFHSTKDLPPAEQQYGYTYQFLKSRRWFVNFLKVDQVACGNAEKIIRACNLDPGTVTVAEMDGLGSSFMCSYCKKPQLLNWREAVS